MAVLLVTLTINMIGIGLLMPVLPRLIEDFVGDISSASINYGLIIALYAAMQFVFGPLLGALSDRFGRRPVVPNGPGEPLPSHVFGSPIKRKPRTSAAATPRPAKG